MARHKISGLPVVDEDNHVIRRVPIVKDDKLVGIVSRADIIPLILEAKNKISDLRYV